MNSFSTIGCHRLNCLLGKLTTYLPYLLLGLLSIKSMLVFSEEQQGGMPPANVKVAEVELRNISPTLDVSGSVISLNDSQLSTKVSGELLWIADVGTKIEQGDIIAKIDRSEFQFNLQKAEARLARFRSDLEFREQEVKRFETLASRDNASKARLQQEIAQRNMLLHDIEDAKATRDLAKRDLNNTSIKAPFSGHLVSRLANKGEFLAIGQIIARVVDTQNLEITLNAPITILPFLKVQSNVRVQSKLGEQILPVRAIVPVGDRVSRMVEVRLSVLNDSWVTGTPVKVSLPRDIASETLAIPRDAIVIKGSDLFIYRITKEMTAEQIKVDIQNVDGAWVSIKNKLTAGDKVVIRGGERMMPGQSVNILP